MQKVNSVANSNSEGFTGRDDLDVGILRAAESIKRRVSAAQSRAVRSLADSIKKSFTDYRNLVKKYDKNIEVVDPQLKNNQDLVEIMQEYESNWEKGKEFLTTKLCNQIVHFSSVIEGTMEKYDKFKLQIEERDAEIFISIPCLLILKSFEDDRSNKDLILSVMKKPMYQQTKEMFEEGIKSSQNEFDYYNSLEKKIIDDSSESSSDVML